MHGKSTAPGEAMQGSVKPVVDALHNGVRLFRCHWVISSVNIVQHTLWYMLSTADVSFPAHPTIQPFLLKALRFVSQSGLTRAVTGTGEPDELRRHTIRTKGAEEGTDLAGGNGPVVLAVDQHGRGGGLGDERQRVRALIHFPSARLKRSTTVIQLDCVPDVCIAPHGDRLGDRGERR